MSNETRKFPGTFGWLALLLLGGSIYLGWYLTRPSTDTNGSQLAADDLEVACTGRVDSFDRQIALEPEVAGKIIKIYVSDIGPNNVVKKDGKILDINPSMFKIKVDQAKLAVDAARIDLEKAEQDKEMFDKQLIVKKKSLAATKANVTQAEKQVEVLRKKSEVTKPPSPIELTAIAAAEASVEGLKALEDAEKITVELFEKYGPLQAAQLVRLAEAKFKSASDTLDEANLTLGECTLKAPADGKILQLGVQEGGFIGPGSPLPLIVFAPAGPLVVRADLEQEYVGRVKKGMKVELRDEARSSSPLWTGEVHTISEYIARKRNVLLDPGEMNDVRTAEVVITLDPSKDELRIGQRMRVRIQTRE